MKKHLLLGSAMLAAFSGAAQVAAVKASAHAAGVAYEKYSLLNKLEGKSATASSAAAGISQNMVGKSASSGAYTWNAIGNSMNVYGVLVSESKPLQMNEDLNAVSFVVRRGPDYVSNPAPASDAKSGQIIAMITSNWGTTWDSTLMWSNDTYWGRYPQGAIYNPLGNTAIANAYIVGTGPVTGTGTGWKGNWFASKKLDAFTNSTSTVSMSQQFYSSINSQTNPPYPTNINKVDFARLGFSATDDGKVRTLGVISNDPIGATAAAEGFRGANILKGTFNSGGYFTWTSDTISLKDCPVDYDGSSYNVIDGFTDMAWSENGEYGYVWFLGVRQGATGNNKGFQPIVWKTSNYGASWSLMPGINFNDATTFAPVLSRIEKVATPVSENTLTIPFFNYGEGISGVVDKNNHLHLVTTLWSTRRSHADSVGIIWTYTNTTGDGQVYRYAHTPGKENYIYDFAETNSGWNVIVVDSMPSELIGATPTQLGYSENPWNVSDGSKVNVDARIQASRTPNGDHIVYTWAESDVNFTSQGMRWNSMPDLHVRARHVDSMKTYAPEFNLTENISGVKSNAFFHNTSPKCLVAWNSNTLNITIPIKITNSTPLIQESTNTHWYTNVNLPLITTSLDNSEQNANTAASLIFPNPASDKATLSIRVKESADVTITVMNNLGQVVQSQKQNLQTGDNNIDIDVATLSQGIYFVEAKTTGGSVTQKLIIE
jgi:hypothetical protein